MTQLINNYTKSRDLVKQRITELSAFVNKKLSHSANKKVSQF